MNTTIRKPLITLQGVTKNYAAGHSTISALADVSLPIYAGELLAIIGPSGSGKTTLSHIIGGLIRPTSGTVQFQSEKLPYKNDKLMSRYRNQTIGFIFQNYSLIPHYSALENVMIPLVVADMPPRKRREIASRYLRLVGLEKQQHQRSHQLSGGQRQRVGIARALVMQPQVIIADEPTGNLDSRNGQEITHILEQLVRSKNITVVMVTHNDELAARAHRIVRITDGKLREVTHARA